MNPVPTIFTNQEILSKPSVTPLRRPPNKRKYEHPLLDQTAEFIKHNLQLKEIFCPAGFSFKIKQNYVLINVSFEEGNKAELCTN